MQALEHITQAIDIIELADQRAVAADGPVSHVRDEMTDQEWSRLYGKMIAAQDDLRRLQRVMDGTTAGKVGN